MCKLTTMTELTIEGGPEDLVIRSTRLINEMQLLYDSLASTADAARLDKTGLKSMLTMLRKEHMTYEKRFGQADVLERPAEEPTGPPHSGANLPAWEAQWDIVKRSKGPLVVYRKRVDKNGTNSVSSRGSNDNSKSVLLDASVQGGKEWLRVLFTTERQLLHEMAEAGWNWDCDEDSVSDFEDYLKSLDEDDATRPTSTLAGTVQDLVRASRAFQYQYQHPVVHIVLPKLRQGKNPEIDKYLRMLRGLGDDGLVTVDCADSPFLSKPIDSLDQVISSLVGSDIELAALTPTIVLDTTTLISLVSDICHSQLRAESCWNDQAKVQVQNELEGQNLVTALYPLIRNRKLVCTRVTAQLFREITSSIASPSELARVSILMGSGDGETKDRLAEFQKLSIHEMPPDIQLPITVLPPTIDVSTAVEARRLPPSPIESARSCSSTTRKT